MVYFVTPAGHACSPTPSSYEYEYTPGAMECTAATNCVFSIGPARHADGVMHPFDGEQSDGVGVGQHIHIVDPLSSGCCSPYGAPQFNLLQGDMHPSTCPLFIMRKSTDFSDTVCPFVTTLEKLPLAVKSSPLGHFAKSNVDASTPLKPQLLPIQSHPDVSPTGVSLYGMVHPST